MGFSKNKEELVLVFHIGSSSVGGAIMALGASTPRIVFSTVEPILVEEKLDADKFFPKTIKTLESVTSKLHKAGPGAIGKVFFVLSSPWYASETRVIKLKKEEPFLVTEKLADELIKNEIKIFSEEHLSQYGTGAGAVRAIELRNIRTALNGYRVADPLGKKASELEIEIFISMAGERVLHAIEETIAKHYHGSKIKFSSFTMALFAVTKDLEPTKDNFMVVDIGGEVTDIFMVKKGVLQDSISFPFGRNFFTREIARRLGATLPEANSLISLFKDGHAEENLHQKLRNIMDDLRGLWLTQFQESLAKLTRDISIPGNIYLTSDLNFADLFSEIIRAEQFSQYTLADSKFQITLLSTELLHSLAKFEDATFRDPFIIIDCVYINRFLATI